MLTLTSEYALRAIIHLAQHEEDWPITAKRIAEEARIPARYLSKVLNDLVRTGVLDSSPGRSGGFRLQRSAAKTTLVDVLSPFEQFDRKQCPFGNQECSDEQPCLAHDRWKKVVEAHRRFLQGTSVRDVAVKARNRRPAKRIRTAKRG